MRFFPLNLLLALGLFCLNALLGAIQYRHRGDLFAYGKFSFDPKPEVRCIIGIVRENRNR